MVAALRAAPRRADRRRRRRLLLVAEASPRIAAGDFFGNGRLEADEINIDTKYAARIGEILADEGDLVKAGQVVARMDTRDLQASLKRSQATVQQANRRSTRPTPMSHSRSASASGAAGIRSRRLHGTEGRRDPGTSRSAAASNWTAPMQRYAAQFRVTNRARARRRNP